MTDRLLQSIYGPADLSAVAFAIANEGRRWLSCDRLTVLELRKRRCRVLAVSGVDVVDRRSTVLGALEELATYVAMSDEVLEYSDGAAQDEGELEQTIDRYIQESHARQLLACPLHWPEDAGDEQRAAVGVVICEQFTKQKQIDELRGRLSEVQDHFALALGHAVARERAPLARLSKRIETWRRATGRHRVLWTIVALLPILALAAASLISVELRVPAQGQLQPAIRQDIFAYEDGVVERLLVQHGDQVQEGQLLVELSQSELEYEVGQVEGQLRTTQQELRAVSARRLNTQGDAFPPEDETRLAAEQERLQQVVDGLTQQRQILRQRQERLQLRSPVEGEIVTWDVTQRLFKRPVRRGQRLLSVVRRHGPWVAELRVEDRDIRHVVLAERNSDAPLPVTFLLATDPVNTYHGTVTQVARVTEGEDDPTVRVTAQIDADQIPLKRPGASLVGRIGCGQRSLAYIWFHDLWDWLRMHLGW